MSLQRRELNLIAIVAVVVIILAGFLITRKKLPVIDSVRDSIRETETNITMSKDMLDKVGPLEIEQAKLGAKLPVYPADEDVKSDLFSRVESLAGKSSLRLINREAEGDEEALGNGVFQFKIACTFEGSAEALMLFLFASQKQGALDVSYLRTEPRKGRSKPGIMNGRFTVDCAYRRQKKVDKRPDPKPVEPAPAENQSTPGETS